MSTVEFKSDRECAERVRLQHSGQLPLLDGLGAAFLGQAVADIAAQCRVTPLKAHRLACEWTVEQAVVPSDGPRTARRPRRPCRWQEWHVDCGGTPGNSHARPTGRAGKQEVVAAVPTAGHRRLFREGGAGRAGQPPCSPLLLPGGVQAAAPIVCLSGQGGVGKTTLAVHVGIPEECPTCPQGWQRA